jgi:hypothetical protein
MDSHSRHPVPLGVVLLAALLATLPGAALGAAPVRTKITAMSLSSKSFVDSHGAYKLRTIVRVRVCGKAGRAAFHISETLSAPGQNKPVYARTRRSTKREQGSACKTHRIAWTLQDKFFGVGRYRVGVRAKTSHRAWSHAAARHSDTID